GLRVGDGDGRLGNSGSRRVANQAYQGAGGGLRGKGSAHCQCQQTTARKPEVKRTDHPGTSLAASLPRIIPYRGRAAVEWQQSRVRFAKIVHMNPYASFLGGSDPLEVMAATPKQLQSLLDAIGPRRIDQAPDTGKWSARDIVCHLADCELVFAFRLRQ